MALIDSGTTTYSILPTATGEYRLEKGGRTMRNYDSRSSAVSAAKSDADDGDQIVVHSESGMIADRMTVGGQPSMGMNDDDVSDMFSM
jgi:hypothetical protein